MGNKGEGGMYPRYSGEQGREGNVPTVQWGTRGRGECTHGTVGNKGEREIIYNIAILSVGKCTRSQRWR